MLVLPFPMLDSTKYLIYIAPTMFELILSRPEIEKSTGDRDFRLRSIG